jgi:hypothetical protein
MPLPVPTRTEPALIGANIAAHSAELAGRLDADPATGSFR